MERKIRLQWLDMAKGIIILMVIICHNGHYMPGNLGRYINRVLGTFDMPFFFVCAGYTFKAKYMKEYLGKAIKRLLVPYWCTAGLMVTLSIIHTVIQKQNVSWGVLLVSFICGFGYPAYNNLLSFGALWFLTAIFCSNIIFNLLIKLVESGNIVLSYCVTLLIALAGVIIGFKYSLPMNLDIGMYAVIYMAFGKLIKDVIDFGNRIIFLFSIPTFILGVYLYSFDMNTRLYTFILVSTLAAMAGSYLFLFLVKYIFKKNFVTDFLCYCGRYSLAILCIHILEHVYLPWNSLYNIIPSAFVLILVKLLLIQMCLIVVRKTSVLKKIYC